MCVGHIVLIRLGKNFDKKISKTSDENNENKIFLQRKTHTHTEPKDSSLK